MVTQLANHILKRCRQVLKKPQVYFPPEALENIVERAVNLVNGQRIEPELSGLRELAAKSSPTTGSEYKGARLAL